MSSPHAKRCERRTLLRKSLVALTSAPLIGIANRYSLGSVSPHDSESKVAFNEKLEAIRVRHGLPGLMAGSVSSTGEYHCEAVGVRKVGGAEALKKSDLMHLGSCTKSMTATLLALTIEKGKLDWDTKLGQAIGSCPELANSPWGDITLEQAMEHMGGLPANAPWNRWRNEKDMLQARSKVAEWLSEQTRSPDSEQEFLYSNVSYMLLGHAIELAEGRAWEEIIRSSLFEPLGMTTAGFGSPVQRKDYATSWGHYLPDQPNESESEEAQAATKRELEDWRPVDSDNPAVLGPAGTVHATMEDWSKYLRLHLLSPNDKSFPLQISQENWDRLHDSKYGHNYAGGWGLGERDWADGPILSHNGCNTMWFCVTFIAPKKNVAIFAAANAGLDAASGCDEALQAVISDL